MGSIAAQNSQDRFLNEKAIRGMQVRSTIQKVFGWILAVFNAIGGGGNLFDPDKRSEFWENLGFVILLFSIAGMLLFLSYRNKRRAALARACASRLPPEGGSVGVPALAQDLGKPAEKLYLLLDWMFKKRVLINCTLETDRETPCITVPGAPGTRSAPELVLIKCPHCDGLTRLPLGGLGRCEWCDSPLRGTVPEQDAGG